MSVYVISLAKYLLRNVLICYISDSLYPNVSVSVTAMALFKVIDIILMYQLLFVLCCVCVDDLAGNVTAA